MPSVVVSEPRRASLPRRVGALALLVLLISVTALSATPHDEGRPWRLLLATLILALADQQWQSLRSGHNKFQVSFGVAGTMLLLILAPLPWALAIQAFTTLVRLLLSRQSAIKLVFNLLCDICAVAIAGLVTAAVSQPGHIDGAAGLTFLAIGCAIGGAVTEAEVAWVVSAAQDVPFWSVARHGLRARLTVLGSSVALGLAIVLLARYSPLTLLAVPVVAVLLVYLHRANVRRDQEDDVWRHLEEAGQEIKQLTERDILPLAIARTSALLRCDRVELVLRDHADPRRAFTTAGTIRGPEGGRPVAAPAPASVAHDAALLTPAVVDGSTIVEVGLNGPERELGLLRVLFAGEVEFRDRERQVLATYARSLATTISNARLYADALREAELKAWLAHHDHLTGLVNRPGLLALTPEIDESMSTTGELFAVLVLDMDHFKEVNDTLGHSSGDRLLQHVSAALAHRVRRNDIAARLDGDRFAVLLRHLPDDRMVEGVVEDILRVVSKPIAHDGMLLSLECSVGFAAAPVDGRSLEELLTHADVAAGQAKQSPGSSRRWRAEPDNARSRLALSADLRVALETGEQLLLHYQPKLDLCSGEIVSVEALARWEHPSLGMLSPAEFIPIAEQSGLARPFTLAVVDAAVAEAAVWRSAGLGGGEVTIAVNLSARNLLDRSLPDDITKICARHGLPTRQLVVEITESVVVSELEIVSEVLAKLREVGVQISVDDFGTGYSSLKFLQSIRVNELKIDRSFVTTMLNNAGDAAIVHATIELGHRLDLRVVAEGVETEEQLDALTMASCDIAQGYLVARPMPAADLRTMLMPSNGNVVPIRQARRRMA